MIHVLTFPLSIGLHAPCQFSHKYLSITRQSKRPKTVPWARSDSAECLSNLRLLTFSRHPPKNGERNNHLHLCHVVKSNPHQQNEWCQALIWRAKVCQEIISPPVPQQRHRAPCSLMRGVGTRRRSPPDSPKNRPRVSCPPCHDTLSGSYAKLQFVQVSAVKIFNTSETGSV